MMRTNGPMSLAIAIGCAAAVAMLGPSRADTGAIASPASLSAHDAYVRCVHAMQDSPTPRYLTYTLHVDADHINIARGYDSSGLAMTQLQFGVSHENDVYRVSYRASDGKSLMRDLSSGAVTIGPVVPWSLDFSNLAQQPAPVADETVSAHSVTTDATSSLLGQLDVDQSPFYRISLAPDSNASSYHLVLESLSGDPNAHALRELVVDPLTFRVQSATFEVGQHRWLFGGNLRLRVLFSQVGPYWLNVGGEIFGTGHYAFVPLHGSYSYHASNISIPVNLPAQTFLAHSTDRRIIQ